MTGAPLYILAATASACVGLTWACVWLYMQVGKFRAECKALIESKAKLHGEVWALGQRDRDGIRKRMGAHETLFDAHQGIMNENGQNIGTLLASGISQEARLNEQEKRQDRIEQILGGEVVFTVGEPN